MGIDCGCPTDNFELSFDAVTRCGASLMLTRSTANGWVRVTPNELQCESSHLI